MFGNCIRQIRKLVRWCRDLHEISKSEKAHNSLKTENRVTALLNIGKCFMKNKCVKFETNPFRNNKVSDHLLSVT